MTIHYANIKKISIVRDGTSIVANSCLLSDKYSISYLAKNNHYLK